MLISRNFSITQVPVIIIIFFTEFEDDPDDNRGGCRITETTEKALQVTASLLGLDSDELRRALTARVMQAAKGGYKGTVIMVPLKVHEASNARDALAKAIYSRLFDFIVGCINNSIPFQVSFFINSIIKRRLEICKNVFKKCFFPLFFNRNLLITLVF